MFLLRSQWLVLLELTDKVSSGQLDEFFEEVEQLRVLVRNVLRQFSLTQVVELSGLLLWRLRFGVENGKQHQVGDVEHFLKKGLRV